MSRTERTVSRGSCRVCAKRAKLKSAQRKTESLAVEATGTPRYFTDKEVGRRFAVSRPTVWRWSNDSENAFPAPVKLSQGVTRWRLQDLLAFEAGLRSEGGRQ